MINDISYAFPAGDESEGSSDEWDIGYHKNPRQQCVEVNFRISRVQNSVLHFWNVVPSVNS